MRRIFLYGVCILFMGPSFGQGLPPAVNLRALFHIHLPALSSVTPVFEAESTPMVFLFLSPDCPLCKSYSLIINQLYKEFGGNVRFYGVIPGNAESQTEINTFISKYHILFPLYRDPTMYVVKKLRAEVTPQVVVLNAKGIWLYTGLIDDRVVALGQQRNQASRHYLREALDAGVAGKTPATTRTTPIGCLINAF